MGKKICIFACGGHGTRMGSEIPKQFLRIGDKTVLQLSMERIVEADSDIRLITVLPREYIPWWNDECNARKSDVPHLIVEGGITRFHSVRNALQKVDDDSIVAVHDGVRPLVSAELVRTLFSLAGTFPAVVPVIPVTDTIHVLDSEMAEIEGARADRSVLFGAQTPQVFRSDILKAAYRQPYDTAFTDDASIVRSCGVKVKYVPGEKYNVKITTPEDLLFVRALL